MSWRFFLDQTEFGTIVERQFNKTQERSFTLQNGMTKVSFLWHNITCVFG